MIGRSALSAGSTRNIYWCYTCGVPLLQKQCEKCGGIGRRIAADLKPMFDEERRFFATEADWPELLNLELPLLWMRQKTIWYNGQRLARLSADGKPRIVKRYDYTPACLAHMSNVETLHAANKTALHKVEDAAVEFIREIIAEHPQRLPIVSFSGGKDSTVVSCLVRKALGTDEVIHVFGDTTIEYPDTYTFAEEFRQASGIPTEMFLMPRASHDWFQMCKELEPPSIIQRWCCTVFKTSPLGAMINSLNGAGVLSFEGIRKCESASRRNAQRVYKNKKIASQLSIRPILHWRDIEVWLYLLINELPINPVYRKGLTRAGCLYCPYSSPFTDYILSRIYPEEISQWHNFLIDHARQSGKSDAEEYVTSGGWKTRAAATNRQSAHTRLKRHGKPCEGDVETRYKLTKPATTTLNEMFKPLGVLVPISDPQLGYFVVEDYKTGEKLFQFQALVDQPYLSVVLLKSRGTRLLLQQIERQIRKFQVCVRCGGCVGVCPTEALSLAPNVTVDSEKCTRCLKCSRFTSYGCIALNSLHASTEIGRKKRMSVGFHLNFALKRSTLSKALQAHANDPQISRDEQMSVIGVGYKAVAGYVGWLHHTGLRDSNERTITELGKLIRENDPYLMDEVTLWVLHYQLCQPSEDESTLLWQYLINEWLPNHASFSRSQFQQGASEILARISEKKLRACANITLRCYVEKEALGSLNILHLNDKLYERGTPKGTIPSTLVAYVMFDQRAQHYPDSTTVAIDELLTANGNVGRVFQMNRAELNRHLHSLKASGYISLMQFADHDHVQFLFEGSPLEILRQYYASR